MGVERRQQPRYRSNLTCELRLGGQSIEGRVRDVSAGGLGVVAEAPSADQGDEVVVTLRGGGLPSIVVRALVWHVRTVRRGTEEKALRSFGLVLSESAPEFAELVGRLAAKRTRPSSPSPEAQQPRAPLPTPEPAAAIGAPPPPAAAARREYRIRIKQTSGPRTCRIVASGSSPEEAQAAALSEVGAGWVVLEVTPVA
jgi:hypothetical protein